MVNKISACLFSPHGVISHILSVRSLPAYSNLWFTEPPPTHWNSFFYRCKEKQWPRGFRNLRKHNLMVDQAPIQGVAVGPGRARRRLTNQKPEGNLSSNLLRFAERRPKKQNVCKDCIRAPKFRVLKDIFACG